jgi:signal transduction histidine kinase
MKKKILIGLGLFSLIFLISAVYTVLTIEGATTKMDDLIRLHQVEILREHLLIQLKHAQSDLYLKNTPYARSMDTIVNHVKTMNGILTTCFACHHAAPVEARLVALKSRVEDYKSGLSRVFTMRSNADRLRHEEHQAFQIGAGLIDEVDSITRMANRKLEERTRSAFQEIRRTKAMLYVLIAIVPIAAIGLSALFLRGLTRPVGELLTATRRLKNGDLEYRIGSMKDEFGEVASSFNEMARALREDRLRMQWAEQLVVLGEMAGGLAHEIKNPLAGIKASMDVLSGDPALSRQNRFLVYKAGEQITRIDGLMKSILNFARPPKPKLLLVDINSAMDSTIGLAERHPAFRDRSGREITVLKDFDQNLPDTMADPMQLQQVFLNLLLNAAYAMPEEGIITVQTAYASSDRMLHVRVTDTGKGIDGAIIDKIFQPFFTTKPNGTGLGLAIIKGLVEQHGGTITVRNNEDRGVTFSIALPLRTTEGSAGPAGSLTQTA